MYRNLMNHTVITYRDWNWSWQNGEEENMIVVQPQPMRSYHRGTPETMLHFPWWTSYLFRIKVTAIHLKKMGVVCILTIRQDTAE